MIYDPGMRRGASSLAGTAVVASALVACAAACNALSGVNELQPCTFCELDGAASLDAAGDDATTSSDGSTTLDARDGAAPGDAMAADAGTDAPAEAGPPVGCQGAVDCERVVFVTSVMYSGAALGGLAGADAKCQALADASPVARIRGRTFVAWLSTTSTSPSLRFTRSTMPYVLGDGTLVASSWLDLTDGILTNAIDIDDQDMIRSGSAWTATTSVNGLQSGGTCVDWTAAAIGLKARYGNVGGAGGGWSSAADNDCSVANALYCFEK
jgi:hypothetical protein